MATALLTSQNNTRLVFFIRHANFAGHGRTHLLKIDNKIIGPLTADNFYRLEMWPGEYHFSVFMPREEFFGQVSEPANVSRQITLASHGSDNAYICSYTDGMGSSGLSLEPITAFPADLNQRSMAKDLNARETAQVTQLHGARYDGPARNGRPHGEGTLSWTDGSAYKGTFLHGVPTRKARFLFPDGRIFMGPNEKGRPGGSGILMSGTGRILFAGTFVDEQPQGVGLRSGVNGPEFCIYDHGIDITKTFRQLAKEALDIEDQQQTNAFLNRVERITADINSLKARLNDLASRHDPDMVRHTFAKSQKKIRALEKQKKRSVMNMVTENQAYIRQLRNSRYKREIARAKAFRKSHDARVEKERQWCRDEFILERNLCACAPLADDFQQWQECWEPLRKRYIE